MLSKLKSVADACKGVNACIAANPMEKGRFLPGLAGLAMRHYNALVLCEPFPVRVRPTMFSEGEITP